MRQRVLQHYGDGTYPTQSVACECGADHDVVIAERDRYGLPVRTVICSDCGLMRTTPRLTAEATARFYDEDYRDLYSGPGNAQAIFDSQRRRGENLLRLVARLLGRGDAVYEIGCGAGGILAPFAAAGCRVAGADLGDEYLDTGRAHGLDLVQGDATDLVAHRGEPARLVLLLHVLEHFLDLPAELAKTTSAVQPGGFLFVEVPGVASVETGYGGDLLRYLQNAHTYHFTAATLTYVLEAAGLEVITATEDAFALCRRPETPQTREPTVVEGEALRILRFLAEQEKAFLRRASAA